MTGQEIFDKITTGDIFLSYINDSGNIVICRTNEPAEIIRLISEGARVISFDILLKCYEEYKCNIVDKEGPLSFSDWIIGELE